MQERINVKTVVRYKIQQDKGQYCLKACEDGDLVDYAEYEALRRRQHVMVNLDALDAIRKAHAEDNQGQCDDIDGEIDGDRANLHRGLLLTMLDDFLKLTQ